VSPYDFPQLCHSFQQALAPFLNDGGLPFPEVLSAAAVQRAFAEEDVDFGGDTSEAVFTPPVVLWAFLSQVLENDKSCRAAVQRILAMRVASGQEPCSSDTAAYCRARAKLPATVLKRLALDAGRNLEAQIPEDWSWHGKHVEIVDGTTLTMPDTTANQEAYPQLNTQEAGAGFPIIRVVVLMSLATGGLLGMAFGPFEGKKTGETALLRTLLADVRPGTILLADRYYCNYWLVAMAQALGLDVVFRMHQLRDFDFRYGHRLGDDDHVVRWVRPQRPEWMDKATYENMPLTLTVRELRFHIDSPGCRTEKITIATTLTDATIYAKDAVADLYHDRWHVEPDLFALKQSLGMDHLRCKSPFMIEKELWVHLLGYNLIRKAGCQAAQLGDVHPRGVSFTATKQLLNAARVQMTQAPAHERIAQALLLLRELAKARVGNRPDRCEPRLVKRRPKQYKHLRKPRAEAKAELKRKRAA
jgi:DDE family transposase